MNISCIEREKCSVIEVYEILNTVLSTLSDRSQNKFIPLEVRKMLKSLTEGGYGPECENFKSEMWAAYNRCIEYLQKWAEPLDEFKIFQWLKLSHIAATDMPYEEILDSVQYLQSKNVELDDCKLFDQFSALKRFLQEDPRAEKLLQIESIDEQWAAFFNLSVNARELCSELIKIAEFYFAIPSHNAGVERIFSLIESQWTEERNRLAVQSVEAIIFIQYNSEMSCKDFYEYVCQKENEHLLKEVQSNTKYLYSTSKKDDSESESECDDQ